MTQDPFKDVDVVWAESNGRTWRYWIRSPVDGKIYPIDLLGFYPWHRKVGTLIKEAYAGHGTELR